MHQSRPASTMARLRRLKSSLAARKSCASIWLLWRMASSATLSIDCITTSVRSTAPTRSRLDAQPPASPMLGPPPPPAAAAVARASAGLSCMVHRAYSRPACTCASSDFLGSPAPPRRSSARTASLLIRFHRMSAMNCALVSSSASKVPPSPTKVARSTSRASATRATASFARASPGARAHLPRLTSAALAALERMPCSGSGGRPSSPPLLCRLRWLRPARLSVCPSASAPSTSGWRAKSASGMYSSGTSNGRSCSLEASAARMVALATPLPMASAATVAADIAAARRCMSRTIIGPMSVHGHVPLSRAACASGAPWGAVSSPMMG
mmetsp:Transcript_18109/g.56183  ORF Transcript_18109/g.56183 Transcript_18109/m.56183 type:complete len:326 (-) Transcript_18109:325-1302(-)